MRTLCGSRLLPGVAAAALAALTGALVAPDAAAAPAGVPFVTVSPPTDSAASPAALSPSASSATVAVPRLAATDAGRLRVSFARPDGSLGRYVYLGLSFESGDFALQVRTDRLVASVAATAAGEPLLPASAANAFAAPAPLEASGPVDAVVRLERLEDAEVHVTLSLARFSRCDGWIQSPCGAVLDEAPEGLAFALGPARRASAADPAELVFPAVIRTQGLHGPIRSDLTLVNRSGATVRATLRFRSRTGLASDPADLEVPPLSARQVVDVVGALLGPSADAEGVLEVRGFVPAAPADTLAETYYDHGETGRIGTTLPAFAASSENARPGRILLAPAAGNPRVNVFSSTSTGDAFAVTFRLMPGPAPVTLTLSRDAYLALRLSDLFPGGAADGALLSVETADPSVHAIATRNSGVSGSPTVFASN